MGRQTDNRISYIRKPMAEHGYLCLGLAGVGLPPCRAGRAFRVRSPGMTPGRAPARGLSGLSLFVAFPM